MGRMKDLYITVYAGGDEAVAAVERIGKDWREQLEQAASEIERLREVNGWVPVSARLPEMGVRVMVGHAKDGWIGMGERVLTGAYLHWEDDGEDLHEPTHWMPLPEPPAECP